MPSGRDELIEMLLERLERVPPDSLWAHRASGLRGALLHALESAETGTAIETQRLRGLTEAAFQVLEQAAKEKS